MRKVTSTDIKLNKYIKNISNHIPDPVYSSTQFDKIICHHQKDGKKIRSSSKVYGTVAHLKCDYGINSLFLILQSLVTLEPAVVLRRVQTRQKKIFRVVKLYKKSKMNLAVYFLMKGVSSQKGETFEKKFLTELIDTVVQKNSYSIKLKVKMSLLFKDVFKKKPSKRKKF